MSEQHEIPPCVLIFGAGAAGENAFEQVKAEHQILAFVDNAKEKQGKKVKQLPVVAADKIGDFDYDKILIASEYFEKIQAQLIELYGLDKAKVVVLPNHMLRPLQFGNDSRVGDVAEKILFLLCQYLSSADIPYFLDAGTLLGIYRDGKLIPWDDDLDIGVAATHCSKVLKAVELCMPELNKLTGGSWQVQTHKTNSDFGVIRKGDIRCYKLKNDDGSLSLPMVDLFVKYVDGDRMDYTLASRGISMPSHHIATQQTIFFKGHALSIPADPEDYLESYYGDWRTPIKQWNLGMIKAASAHQS